MYRDRDYDYPQDETCGAAEVPLYSDVEESDDRSYDLSRFADDGGPDWEYEA